MGFDLWMPVPGSSGKHDLARDTTYAEEENPQSEKVGQEDGHEQQRNFFFYPNPKLELFHCVLLCKSSKKWNT